MYGGLLVCVVFWDICNTQKHCETHCWGERTMINVVCAVETTEMRIKSKQRMIKLFTDLFISLKFFNLTFLWIWSNRFINVPLSITRSITSFQSSNAKNIYNLTPKNGKGWAVEWEKENPLTPSVYSCDLCPLGWSDAKACFAVIAADMLYRHCMFYKKKLSVKTWVWVWRWCYCSVFSVLSTVDQLHPWLAGSLGRAEEQHSELLQVSGWEGVWLQGLAVPQQGRHHGKNLSTSICPVSRGVSVSWMFVMMWC